MPDPDTYPRASLGTAARAAEIGLGVWMFISGALLTRPAASRLDAFAVGAAVAVCGEIGLTHESARFMVGALSVWIAASTSSVFRLEGLPLWSDYLVAIALFALSMVPNEAGPRPEALGSRG
jgi:hypothetical protein